MPLNVKCAKIAEQTAFPSLIRSLFYGDSALTYSVRPMSREDLPQVNEIDREAFPSQWPPPNYRHELQNQMAHYLVACDDSKTIEETEAKPDKGVSKLVSRIGAFFSRRRAACHEPPDRKYIVGFAGIWVMADEAHVTNIAVRRQYLRQGLGELLLISTIDLAKQLKVNSMTLEVRVSNIAAQNLYRKYSFAQVGLRRGYYLDNREDGMLMSTESITSDAFQAHLQQLRENLARRWGQRET